MKNPFICEKHFNNSDIHQDGKYATTDGIVVKYVSTSLMHKLFIMYYSILYASRQEYIL